MSARGRVSVDVARQLDYVAVAGLVEGEGAEGAVELVEDEGFERVNAVFFSEDVEAGVAEEDGCEVLDGAGVGAG